MALSIVTSVNGESRVIRVSGEVDVSNKDELNAAIASAQSEGTQEVEVDLSEVSYIDSSGIGVLVAAAHRATDEDRRFFVSHPQRNVARVLSMLGMGAELGLATD
jgi:anti-sigma B factor antagonist